MTLLFVVFVLAIFLGSIIVLFVGIGDVFFQKVRSLQQIAKQYLYMIFGFLLGWSPFLAFEIKNGFPNLRTIQS
jgi:hypothetical protein